MNADLNARLVRTFRAPVDKVFRAFSDPTWITQWWKNLSVAEMDFRVGGGLRLCWDSWDGEVTGTYREIVVNKRIVFTWNSSPAKAGRGESTVIIELYAHGDTTELRLTHTANSDCDELKSHHEGWSGALADLAAVHERQLGAVVVERLIDAPAAKVFAALTQKDKLERWFFSRCKTEPRVDGSYHIEWEDGADGGRNHRRYGRYLDMQADRRIQFEWRGLDIEDEAAPTVVTIDLSEENGKTRLRLEHRGWGDSDAWRENRDGHEAGWSFYVDNLSRFILGSDDLRADFGGQRTYAPAAVRAASPEVTARS